MTIAAKLDELLGAGQWRIVSFSDSHILDPADIEERDTERGDPRQPEWLALLPRATHRIVNGKPVCEGDRSTQCHWHPDCDRHETWPCGCEYVAHDDCFIIPWLTATELDETAFDEALDRRDPDELTFPDGAIELEWDGEAFLWTYATETEPASINKENNA